MHNMGNIEELYNDAMYVYTNLVTGDGNAMSGDSILASLSHAIELLKENWRGKGAGTNIGDLVMVHNVMATLRDDLGALASKMVSVANYYRRMEIAAGGNTSEFGELTCDTTAHKPEYSDDRDTLYIDISAGKTAQSEITNVINVFDAFTSAAQGKYDDFMTNWKQGSGHDDADQRFEDFFANARTYKTKLETVCENITNAMNTYGA